MDIINPGSHKHREVVEQGRRVCQDCHQILITPILSHDDERILAIAKDAKVVAEAQRRLRLIGSVKWAHPNGAPADFLLMTVTDRLGDERPDYIWQLSEKYDGEEPPHVQKMEWWND